VPVAGVVIAAVAWSRYQSRKIKQSHTSDTKKRKKRIASCAAGSPYYDGRLTS
jgi:hypothetical protein